MPLGARGLPPPGMAGAFEGFVGRALGRVGFVFGIRALGLGCFGALFGARG